MKKTCSILILAAAVLMTGCGTLMKMTGLGPELTPYDQGYKDVQSYVMVRPFLEEEHRQVIASIYQIVTSTDDLRTLTDTFLEVQVARLYGDSVTPEERTAILALFGDARDSLIYFVDDNLEIPESEIYSQYINGAQDAVTYYNLLNESSPPEE